LQAILASDVCNGCLHVTARFATLVAGKEDDDFDPTTLPENSGTDAG
jgi:hypothetical protein